jgi:hypothetical protein
MSIYWIQTDSDDVFAALDRVEQAVTHGDQGNAPHVPVATSHDTDPYLIESLAVVHQSWAVDQNAIIMSTRTGFAGVINLFQRFVRRLTWWQSMPQWLQVNSFHGALVRVIDVLLDRQRLHSIRIDQLESANTGAHIFALEQQIQALRDEQRELRKRLAELEKADSA